MGVRHPGFKPPLKAPTQGPVTDVATELEALRKTVAQLVERVNGLGTETRTTFGASVKLHGSTHDMDGTDPLSEPGTPADIAIAAVVGVGPGKANEDHAHATPLTTKGDQLTVNAAGLLARRGVGANGDITVVDSSEDTGHAWQNMLVKIATDTGGVYPQIIRFDASQANKMFADNPWTPYLSTTLTDNVQTSIFHHAVTDLSQASGRVTGKVYAADAADAQCYQFDVSYTAVSNAAGTITVFYEQRDFQSGGAVSSGTLTVACVVVADEANNRVTFKITANSSLTPTSFSFEGHLIAMEWGTVTLL